MMKAFYQIASPQEELLTGSFSIDLFSADLWDVYKRRALEEYAEPELFFLKSHQSDVMEQLCQDVAKRLQRPKGDSVFCLQGTPGMGKTHALITLYHKAKEWNAKPLVLVGTALGASDTLWGSLEEQLHGKRESFRDQVSPGREALRTLLKSEGSPIIILVDELLHYITKAATVQVGESTLAAQTLAFLQEISEVISSVGQIALVISLPAGSAANYDEQASWFWGQFQKILGRIEKVYTPIRYNEFPSILRQRLFGNIDRKALDEFLDGFMERALAESLVPAGVRPAEYRSRFEASYPFLPDSLDLLYQCWGEFPAFQALRGMLRVLSLVIATNLKGEAPYLSLADFNLSDHHLQCELLRHVGRKFEDVLEHDILNEQSGAKQVDREFAKDTGILDLGTRIAQTIFLCSFSSSKELHGIGTGDIRRQASTPSLSTNFLGKALLELKNSLHYLHEQHHNVYSFNLHPNLNRFFLMEMDNIDMQAIEELEKELLKKRFSSRIFHTAYWVNDSSEVPDNPDLKLILMKQADAEFMHQVLSMKGKIPRVNQNTIFFVVPIESARSEFSTLLKQFLAWGMLLSSTSQTLSHDQRKEVKNRWKQVEMELDDAIRHYYRRLFIPTEDNFRERDLSMMPFEGQKTLAQVCYELLVSEGEILEHLEPGRFRLCLQEKPFVFTEQLFRLCTTTLGRPRVADKQVCAAAIKEGVRQGAFGLGVLRGKDLICDSFKQEIWGVDFSDDEVIIREDLCRRPSGPQRSQRQQGEILVAAESAQKELERVHVRLKLPKGNVTQLMGVLYALRSNFDTLILELEARDGMMSSQEYSIAIEETLKMLEIEVEEL